MKERAYAKINLYLRVGEKRLDGYHNLKMLMLPIQFYDLIELHLHEHDEIIADHRFIPLNANNTMYKALDILRKKYCFKEHFKIIISKRIPIRAGLAGGSADAAAIIRMINKILQLHMKKEDMIKVALEVGSDVPFCLFNKASIVEGKGEILTPIKVNLPFFVFLAKPKEGVSTKEAFMNLRLEDKNNIDIDQLVLFLKMKNYKQVAKLLVNDLEKSAMRLVPTIESLKKELINLHFDGVLMSGSGSTVFGISQKEEICDYAFKELRKKGYFVRKTRILGER